jgi:lipoprotein NlpI
MKTMFRMWLCITLLLLALGCSSGDDRKGGDATGRTGSATGSTQRIKIDRLTPEAFFRVSIALMEEQKKWSDDFRAYMDKKRKEFYDSFGITEKKYNDYSMNNHAELQQYLQRNPQLNQTMARFRSMYTQ